MHLVCTLLIFFGKMQRKRPKKTTQRAQRSKNLILARKKNISPMHERRTILAWNFHSRLEIFILTWKFQSRALFFCGQRGARNEEINLNWKFHSVLKAWFFFRYCASRLIFINPGDLCEGFSSQAGKKGKHSKFARIPCKTRKKGIPPKQGRRRSRFLPQVMFWVVVPFLKTCFNLTCSHADFGKEFHSRTLWRYPSWNCPSPCSELCPWLFRTEHLS